MELPDCPPGAEGYQDSVTEVPKKLDLEESCTKAEQEFQEHLNSLKIKIEDGSTRCMVERRGRDISGKWIYLCYPCAAVCSGESILQTHISGKKHKIKLSLRNVWPMSIFDEHPFNQNQPKGGGPTEKILQKMAEEVDLYNKNPDDLEVQYEKYRNVHCHIQESLDAIKAPLVGVEYLIEHPPEQSHYEPSYICTLCSKQGHPRTIVNHMTCFWHRYNFLVRHFAKACSRITPYRAQPKYREGVSIIMNRLAQRIEDKYGRMKPVHIDKEEYEKDKDRIHRWIFKSQHFCEKEGATFEEVADIDLIDSLFKSSTVENNLKVAAKSFEKRDPSPPIVAAPSRPQFSHVNRPAGRQQRRGASMESLSDISDDQEPRVNAPRMDNRPYRDRQEANYKPRFEPYHDKFGVNSSFRSKYGAKNMQDKNKIVDKPRNHEYKVKLAEEKRQAAEESAKKTLAYHEKNPEKHPLYPEEWKKFWNRRYKEIQTEGKDPSKHDFKPEWIVFWTKRMKELHDDELRIHVNELYRKMCLSPPDMTRHSPENRKSPETRKRSLEPKRKSVEIKRRSLERRRSPYRRDRRTPDFRRSSPGRRPSPQVRRPSPPGRRLSPPGRRPSPPGRRPSPPGRRPSPPGRRSSPPVRRPSPPGRRLSPLARRPSPSDRRQSPPRRRSPPRYKHTRSRSRSPHRSGAVRSRPVPIPEYMPRRSRSPLSRRDAALRNRSPHQQIEQVTPSMQTVLVSDDELKPDDISPWNSDNDIESISSIMETRSHGAASAISRASRTRNQHRENIRPAEPQDLGPAENVIATLRMLVALEDYLGSLGPKIIDLLTEALKMEKEKANSSEDLLERDSALVLIETAKEKLKGAAQAGLVAAAAAAAVRAAVVRAAATLHAADTRATKKNKQTSSSSTSKKAAPVPVAGVGEVDRAQIAQQMAAALIAQGKTDVSSEELAQLVDAVVGMAEAKKREADIKKKVEARAASNNASRPVQVATTMSGTASALQMLQSAYDENDKKIEKEEVPDAMDGLSDSDLETLLKNFNELSAEEQHSLIAYLKKLEAKQPQRVERLRQYVSADATPAPLIEESAPKEDVEPVTIESDDDDYTVEEVFISATQKVKENQIRQEMEIVKKSLEESKETPPKEDVPKPEPKVEPLVNITKNLSSAANLLALVQASIQSTAAPTPAPITQKADVVSSSTQPRSFGDLPESPMPIATIQSNVHNAPFNQNPTSVVQSLLHSQALQNEQGGSQPLNNQQGGSKSFNNQQGASQPFNNQQGGSQSHINQQGGSQLLVNQRIGSQPFNTQQGGHQPFDNQQGGSQPFNNQQGGSQPFENQQGGSHPFNNQQGGTQPFNNQQGGSQPFNNQHGGSPYNNQSSGSQPFNSQQGSQPYHNNQGGSQQFQDDTQDGTQQYYNEQQGGSQPFNNEQHGGVQPFQNSQGGSQPFHNNQQGGPQPYQNNQQGGPQPFYNNQGGSQPFKNNQQGGLLRPQQNFDGNRNNQNNTGPWNQRPINNMQDNRGPPIRPAFDNYGQGGGQFNNQHGFNQHGQGPRGNFKNGAGRNQDNFNARSQDMNRQNFNNNDNHNHRGRGGGRGYGGQTRGRGRGYY